MPRNLCFRVAELGGGQIGLKGPHLFAITERSGEFPSHEEGRIRLGGARQAEGEHVAVLRDLLVGGPVDLVEGSLAVQETGAVQYRQARGGE